LNVFGINPLALLRRRLGAVAAACCVCGTYMAFVPAPGQALTAASISRLPVMDAAAVSKPKPKAPKKKSGR
jgi:hypothetical protein